MVARLLLLLALGGGWIWLGGCSSGAVGAPPPTEQPAHTEPLQTQPPAAPSEATATAVATTAPPASEAVPELPPLVMNDPALEEVMLEAINRDRQEQGLSSVAWDATAAQSGALHAADMAEYEYFSHWDQAGHGPQYRYNQVGGYDSVQENIFTYGYHFEDGSPAPIEDFAAVVRDSEASLMNSPGHRANILSPEHTHVGVGFAYNPQTGNFYLAQEFVNRYVEMEPMPAQAQLGENVAVVGRLLPGADEPLINLAYESLPQPMSIEELNATGTYISDAEIFEAISPDRAPDESFQAQPPLDNEGQAGLYSVRVWVQVEGQPVLASEWMIEVE